MACMNSLSLLSPPPRQFIVAPYPGEVKVEFTEPTTWLKDGAKEFKGKVVLVKAGSGIVIPTNYIHGARNVGGRVISLNISVCSKEGFPSMLEGTMLKAGRGDAVALGPGIFNLARDYTDDLCAEISVGLDGAATLMAFMRASTKRAEIDNGRVRWAKAKLHLLLDWCCLLAVLHASGTEGTGQGRGGWIIGFDAAKAEGLIKKMKQMM